MREKLIKLLEQCDQKCEQIPCEQCTYNNYLYDCCNKLRTDHLIANGVTIQKWIPVSERLPEQDQEVLCYMGNFIGTLMDVYTYKGDNKWDDTYGNWNYTDIEGITHWMPLPSTEGLK